MLWGPLQAEDTAEQAKHRTAEALQYGKETVNQTAEQAKQRTAEGLQYGKETVNQTADQVMQCQPATFNAVLSVYLLTSQCDRKFHPLSAGS